MPTAEKIDSNNALTWPEDSPTITMDAAIGKNKRRYDVDMAELHRLLDIAGVDKGRSALGVHLEPEVHFGLTGGHYSINQQKANVSVNGLFGVRSRESTINEALLHELGHHFQYTAPRLMGSLALHNAYGLSHKAFEREARRFARGHKKDFHILRTTKIDHHRN